MVWCLGSRITKAMSIGILSLVLLGCDCKVPLEVTSIQKNDKKLACKDIILEINEAEHYRAEAIESRKISTGEMLMPTCWLSGYIDGAQAIRTSDARIEYLGHIYDLLDCGGIGGDETMAPPPARREQGSSVMQPTPPGAAAVPFVPMIPAPQATPIPPLAPVVPPPASEKKTPHGGLMQDEEGYQYKPLTLPQQK